MKYSLYRSAVVAVFLLLGAAQANAQTPSYVPFTNTGEGRTNNKMMCTSDAGSIMSLGPFIGQSNDRAGDTNFFCFGESLFVNHDYISIDLSGDPFPGTPGGVGYAFYGCEPTVDGPTLDDIVADP
ncbi:MAG: hypothetical protein AAGA62_17815, partial [Bacteroidota bacterium]